MASHRGDRWMLDITTLANGVVVVHFEGFATAEVGKIICQELDAAVTRDKNVTLFDDWAGAIGYDSSVRTDLTDWMARNVASTKAVHILVRSKIVSMGIAVGAMIVGNAPIHTYSDRERWQSVLDRAISESVRSPRRSA